jgi:G3E family GTPase
MTIQIDIFSGFFGAGKTTLIKKLIDENVYSKKVTLIENEFGEIPIDGTFLKKYNIEIKEIKAGCICCATVNDFYLTLKEIIDAKETERIIIEPSGVGKLSEIVKIVRNFEQDYDISLNLIISAVDVTMYEEFINLFSEFYEDQIAHASTIILSRTQNIEQSELEQVVKKIREINYHAAIATTPWDDISGVELIGLTEHEQNNVRVDSDEQTSLSSDHEHDHDHDHDEDDHNHDIFTSWGIETPKIFSIDLLKSIFEGLKDESSFGKIVRSKGKVQVDNVNWVEFDFVPNAFEIRQTDPDNIGRITVIGHELNKENLVTVF